MKLVSAYYVTKGKAVLVGYYPTKSACTRKLLGK